MEQSAHMGHQEQHKRDCLARYYLDTKSRDQIADWLKKQKSDDFQNDMRQRLNEQRALLKHRRESLETSEIVSWVWLTELWTLRELEHCLKHARIDGHGKQKLIALINQQQNNQQTPGL